MDSFTEVFTWGSDQNGQLGLGGSVGKCYPLPRLCSFNVLIKELSCGEEHAGFISSQGHVYTMGSNSEGRLGIDDRSISYSSSPCLVSKLHSQSPLRIACGWGHTALTTASGAVLVWGVAEFGALGLGSESNQWSPSFMKLPEGFEAESVSCGSRHTAVLSRSGRLAMVGCGEAGQLGTRRREKESIPVVIEAENVVQVACGVFHTVYVASKGQVFAMGGNSFGQLGLGNKKSTSTPERLKALESVYVTKIACGHHSAAICDKGNLYIWGSGSFGEHLTPFKVNLPSRVRDVSVGGTFTVAVLQDLSVYSWGNNSSGELGQSDYEVKDAPASINSLCGKKITRISCGGSFCIALGSDVSKRRVTSHVRSHSKAEYIPESQKLSQTRTEKKSAVRTSVAKEYTAHSEFSTEYNQKHQVLRLEELLNDVKMQNERLKYDIDESSANAAKLKNSNFLLEKNLKHSELETVKLKEENQQLLLRLQEVQMQYKSFVSESKSSKDESYGLRRNVDSLNAELKGVREENLLLRRDIDCLKQSQLTQKEQNRVEIEIEVSAFRKSLEEERQKLIQSKSVVEKRCNSLTEENMQLRSQLDELHAQMNSVSNELKHRQSDDYLRKSYEKENFHSQISAKNIEIDKLASSYHDLMIQFNRLIEENKIYKQTNLELEEKNRRLFENLEKELAARAHDYKERTLNILATGGEREIRKSVSPVRTAVSPIRSYGASDLASRTKLSEATQAKIGNTAARLLAKMESESALNNIRISSPSRRSPERPVPYKTHQVSRDVREALRSKIMEYREETL